jgi:hypothetical protein
MKNLTPGNLSQGNIISMKEKIGNDLSEKYKEILIKYLDDRKFNEEKIYSWINNILEDAKEYFTKKYIDYNLFLYCYICPKSLTFRSNYTTISNKKTDSPGSVNFSSESMYCVFYYFYYLNKTLNYSIDDFESELIIKCNKIFSKHLDERTFNYEKIITYNKNINDDYINFILSKNNSLRCFCLNEIYKNPISYNYCFKYLSHGKNIYSKKIQTYTNDSLTSCNYLFFFK